MEQAVASTNEQTDSILSRAQQNFIPSSKQLVQDTVEMITHPVQTAKSLYQLGSGIVQLVIPGEQGNENTARAVGQHLADRYGSIEKAKETFATDPAGFAVDALGIITGGGALGVSAAKTGAKATAKLKAKTGNKVIDESVTTAPMKTVDEMAELTASVKVTDDVISNQIKEFNKGKTLKSNKWTEPIWYHGSGQRNLKNFEGDPSVRYESHQGAPFGTFITPDIIDASTYGPYLYTVRIKKDLKIWTMGRRNEPLPKKGVIEKIEPDRPHMLYKPITLGKTDNKITSSMLKAYEKHLTNYYGGPDMMIPRLLDDFKKSGRIKYELPASQMTDILRKGGYQAVNDGQGHVIMLNPKKDIKIEGVADNSNVAVNVGTHMQHERKLVEAERLAPLDQAMYSTRSGFTDYTVEPPIEYKKLDLNVKGLPIIDEAKEAHKNSLISVLNQGDLTRKETAGVIEKLRSLGVPNLAKGGSFILKKGKIDMENVKFQEGGFAMQQAAVQGNSSTDNLRNASVTEEQKKKDIKQKAIKDATEGKKNTNADVAKLNSTSDEKLREQLFAQEGVIPVKEKKYTPSDYFKTEMMSQWLYAEGEGDKDGQKTNQAFKGIHIDSYPELAEEIRQGKLTDEKVAEIMYRQYTGQNVAEGEPSEFRDLSKLEDVSPEAAKLLFMDAGYTGKNAEAIRDLQRYLGVKDDGLLGEDTLGAMQGFNAEAYRDHLGTLDRYKDSPVYNRFFTEEERIERGLYNKQAPQMAEGGLTENNDDTLGATEKEVADDIPAQISEGELVVPANVVRYHGLSTYESLRQSALLGLKGLEEEGQLKKVDENGIPVEEDKEKDKNNNDVKVQTVKMLTAKDGAFPDVSGDGKVTRKDVLLARGVNLQEGGSVVVGGGRLDTEKNPPPYGTTKNPRGETTVKYDPPTGTGKYNYTEEGIEKFMNENPVINNMRMGGRKSFRYYDKETNEIVVGSHDTGSGMESFDKKETRYSPEEYFSQDQFTNSEYFNPADYFSQDLQGATKGTLTTPEGKDYRVTNPNLKITAQGPRTQNIVGGNYTGVDLENMPGFGRTPGSGGGASGPSTTEKLLSGVTTVMALDKLFFDGKITEKAWNWAKENIFDPVGEFLGFDKAAAASAGILTAPGSEILTTLSAADTVGAALSSGNVLGIGTWTKGIPLNADIVTRGMPGAEKYFASFVDDTGVSRVVEMSAADVGAHQASIEIAGPDAITGVTTGQTGVWNWKTGLAAVGMGLSLYDIIENGPSLANVAGLGASVGTLIGGKVFTGAIAQSAFGQGLAAMAGPLAFVALAAGLVEAFSGPPTNAVGEAAYNFDNPEYNADDILSGGFWTRKREQKNIDGAKGLVASVGSYVNALEESLEIDIGGELFIDVGNREGLRYGYVEGYDELGMKKYHKTDLDYDLLHGPGQVGKGFTGEDAVQQLMDTINDDINVLTMFALADKAAGGKGYATFDKIGEYRNKLNVLTTYKPVMAGSNAKAVLNEQERNILQGFQQKEFAEVTGEELAVVLTLYDKIKPVHTQNQYQGFSYQGM